MAGGVDGLWSKDDVPEDAEGGVISRGGVVLLLFGGESGAEGGRAGFVGREARGDGGGRTNEFGRSELGGTNNFMDEKDGGGMGGMYSVS